MKNIVFTAKAWADFISQAIAQDLFTDNLEIIKMLTTSINTAKNNLH